MLNQFYQTQETLIEILTLGPSEAGKSSLLNILTQNNFNQVVFGANCSIKTILLEDELVKLQIWDLSGSDKFRIVVPKQLIRRLNGIFLTFDISSEQSFKQVNKIYQSTISEIKNMKQNICCVLVGCKSDLEDKREISYNEAITFAESLGMHYIETSAKTSKNCLEAAQLLVKCCLEQRWYTTAGTKPKLNELQLNDKKKSKCY